MFGPLMDGTALLWEVSVSRLPGSSQSVEMEANNDEVMLSACMLPPPPVAAAVCFCLPLFPELEKDAEWTDSGLF